MAINKLKPMEVQNAKPGEKDYKLPDGAGLYLLIKKAGGKYWRFNYRFGGKHATLALGVYPDVPLNTARKRRDEARQMLADSKDPREIKKAEKDEPTSPMFEVVAREWHRGTMGHPEWKEITRNKILREMENHLFPAIGSKPIDTLKTRDLLPMLIDMTEQGIGATVVM